ncbi:FirrV-1-A18 [Feldmannia irregularis virus a]|uniref:DNA polymerase n=2 Tax=root TaxID=1 RepID=Q6XM69_9PHYC|nr:FirrV-1-A18 [Feldmannia irregularis virus a]AAR26842.1 FirrV-1-A18 [Feldmannia irregularis virus a]
MLRLFLHDALVDNVPKLGAAANKQFPEVSVVRIFAVTQKGEPTYVEVKNFRPWFYIDLVGGTTFDEFKVRVENEFWFRNVVSCEVVRKKRFIGFSDDRVFDYVQVKFTGLVPMYTARKALRDGFRIYEDHIDPLLKFFHSSGVRPSSYFEIQDFTTWTGQGKTHCSLEYYVVAENIRHCVDLDGAPPPPMPMCAYDIESSGLDPTSDYVFQVSMCFGYLGEDVGARTAVSDSVVVCVGQTTSLQDTPVLCVDNEYELLKKFRDLIIQRQICILVGYNSYQFDGQFLYKRAVNVYRFNDFCKIGFLRNSACTLTSKVLESSALGKNELSQFVIPGRVEFDALMTVRRNHKLGSYKLDSVCKHFFGGEKDDVSYGYIIQACKSKDPEALGKIAKYCLQDSWLTLKLVSFLKDVYNGLEMSKLCVVPLRFIESRGQQIKCLSLILDRIHSEYVLNRSRALEQQDQQCKFQGATVISAKKGFHCDDPVVCLDFASLYPSIIRWKNLCYTTHVDSDEFLDIDGVDYEKFEVSAGVYETFARRPGRPGILAMIEEDLGEARKLTKRRMKSETDPTLLQLLNSKQLAQKITMNSLYGFCGTVRGCLPLVAIAAAVTATGRFMIKRTADFIRNDMKGVVIYGDTDSVMCTFPVEQSVRDQGNKALLEHAYEKGLQAEQQSLELFGHPVKLEYEKMYFPFLLLSKKRYASMCYETPDTAPKITTSGLVTVRRDNAKIVRDCANEVIRILMERQGADNVVKYVDSVLRAMDDGTLDLEMLTISNELKKHPEQYSTPSAHSVLAGKRRYRARVQKLFRELIKPVYENEPVRLSLDLRGAHMAFENLRRTISFQQKRDVPFAEFVTMLAEAKIKPTKDKRGELLEKCTSFLGKNEVRFLEAGIHSEVVLDEKYREFAGYDRMYWENPGLGTRVPYVIVRGKGSVNERSEDPTYVKIAGEIRVDTKYYVDQQLRRPIMGMVESFPQCRESLARVFDEYSRKAENANNGRREITTYFQRSVRSRIES